MKYLNISTLWGQVIFTVVVLWISIHKMVSKYLCFILLVDAKKVPYLGHKKMYLQVTKYPRRVGTLTGSH